jgi:hypothetical protein
VLLCSMQSAVDDQVQLRAHVPAVRPVSHDAHVRASR